jgi:hypothetical protein
MNAHMSRSLVLACATLAAPALTAQGLRWPDPSQQPVLHAREHADGSWSLCFDGWSMTSGVPFAGGAEGTTIGIDPGARAVTTSSTDVLKGGDGGNAFAALFPFAPDPRVLPIFRPHMPGLDVFGFLAPISGPVPDAGLASVSYRITLAQPQVASVLVPMLANTRMGMATTDPVGAQVGRAFVVAPSRVLLGRVLYYSFDRGAGTQAINAAGIEGGAKALADLSRPAGSPWTGGRFGFGLRAGTTVDTGFHGDLGSRFTVAWFMRGNAAPSAPSPILGLGNWRIFTGGAAGKGLRCTGWGGAQGLDLPDDVQALAAGGWVHVALVADGDLGQAAWFVNGILRRSIVLPAAVAIPASAASLEIGSTQGLANVYDLDELRLDAAAQNAGTIVQWASRPSAAALPFTSACGASLRSTGMPAPGGQIDYRVEAAPGSQALLALGFSTQLGAVPLPLDLGLFAPALAGCAWYSDLTITLPAVPVPPGGIAVVPLNVPNNPALAGLEVYAQALVNGAAGPSATNAHLISIR